MIAKEGFLFIAVPVAAGILFLYFSGNLLLISLGCLFILAGLFCAFFFRDPSRKVPQGDNLIISACDGVVMEAGEAGGEKVIRVFLSVFNVHIQRSPVSGAVEKVEYRHGKFLPAMKPEAHIVNEQNVFTIQTPKGKVIVKQIAGILARRVVAWSKAGDALKTGDKIGLIKFSSQVDVHIPVTASIKVKPGDKVIGGETVIGEF
jgi:phosphatidylserine decarboxylase